MKKILHKYIIPHEGNEFKPRLWRARSVMLCAALILVLFFSALLQSSFLRTSDFAAALLPGVLTDLANGSRKGNGVAPLAISPFLEEAARRKAEDMARKGYFAHTSPDGLTPWHWFVESGYRFASAGENLAIDFSDSEALNRAWLNSETHRANILNQNFTEVGIATAQGVYNGRETTFVVQMFGRPLPQGSAVAAEQSTQSGLGRPDRAAPSSELPIVAGAKSDVILENESFVVIQHVSDAKSTNETTRNEQQPKFYAGPVDLVLTSPIQTLQYIYIVIGAFIAVLLIIFLYCVESEKLHLPSMMYGLLLLIFIGAAGYMIRTVIVSPRIM